MNWKKRIVSLALAAVIGLSTFLASGVEAEAAGAIAKGIDVSKYQGAINWSAVAAEGYSFAFIKVGSAKSGLILILPPTWWEPMRRGLRREFIFILMPRQLRQPWRRPSSHWLPSRPLR